MSKRKRGVSLQEKRERLLGIYHDTKEVFNLKQIEKLGAAKGVVLQTIKDVNQELVDDNLVDQDKIGSGNFFWSFPSKLSQQKKAKVLALQDKLDKQKQILEQTQARLEAMKNDRVVSEERTANLKELAELKARKEELNQKLAIFKENDPAVLAEIQKKIKIAKEGADRWTDNIFTLQSWIIKKQNCSRNEVNKFLGINEDFDYVE